MPSPKDIKNLLKATQGTKAAGKAMDLEELLATLPKGTKAQQLEAELMFKRLAEEQAARYAPTNPPTERGNKALAEAKKTLAKKKPDAQKQALEDELARLQAGKEEFLSPSQIKERLYHATPANFSEFQGEGFDPTISGHATWLGYDPTYQPAMHNISGRSVPPYREGVNVMPVHVQAKSPLVLDDPVMIDWARQVFAGGSGEFPHLMPKDWAQSVKDAGYDSIIFAPPGSELKHQEVIMLEPKRIKSAIGNQGTYDIENPDITKAEGGVVHMAGGGGKLLKTLRAADKASEATQDVSQVTKASKPLSLAERQLLAEHGLIVNQAPTVIVPSKISNVQKAMREKKGEFGAKRVQRAADEIKNLERLYTEEALRQAFGGDNAKALMTMNPEDFERYAVPLEPRFMDENSTRYTSSGERLNYPEYMSDYLPNVGAFSDVPFLQINKEEQGLPLIPFISGHEGRHRNRVMANKGEKSGLVQLLPRAELREPFPRRDPEEYLEALRKELEMTGNMVLPERYLDDGDVYIKRPAIELPDIYAEGGGVHLAGGGGKLLKALRGANKAADATQDVQSIVSAGKPLTAAERAMVGKLAEEYTANQPVIRLSEALGNVGAEGKNLRVTQTDRTSARNLGGAPFSMMQKVDPRYAQARATWGVKTPGAAKNITNQSDADVVWSTLIGSPTQHRSNELIFNKLYRAFQKSAKEGNLSAELHSKFNAALEPIFGEGADILDPKLRKEIDTFEKRAVVGNLLLGEGLGGALRGGSIIPGPKIMAETTEPMLKGAETFSIGPRLFTLDKGVITRPDLHPAFPEILTGEDLNQLFTPVPNRIALPTFNEDFRARTGRKKPSYYDLTMTPEGDPYPTQFVDEDYLNFLQKEGYAHGGLVHMAGGGDAGDVSDDMFHPKPLKVDPLNDFSDAVMRQFRKEKRSMSKPGALTDLLLRGPVTFTAGTPMDLLGMAGEGLDWLQTKIPGLRTNASVMDQPRSVVDKRPPDMGYAPKIKFGPEPKVQPNIPFDASQYIQTNDPKLRAFINKRQKEINSSPQLPIVEEARMPYGTEHFQEMLNQSGLTTGEERPLFELGSALVSPFAAEKALKYGKAGAKWLAPTAQDMLQMSLEKLSEPTRSYVIKPEGGNWVAGSVEKYLDPLKYKGPFAPETFPEYNREGARAATAINNFVDKKLSKYMRNEMGTPSDPVRIQADEWANKQAQLLADKQKQIDKARADMERAQRERNVTPDVLTRSQARIRELEKERALIENRSGLHYTPPNAGFQAELRRKNSKQPSSVEAKTEAGKSWENVSDASILSGEYGHLTPLLDNELYTKGTSAERLKAQEDALREIGGEFAVQNPEAIANKMDMGFGNTGLGWDHLTDELENAMTRTSGLPENLLLDPKTVDKMSVPQAIEHVDKINAWRASQKAEADAARAANIATVTHKEYPDAGLKWVELKVPELIEQFKVPDRYEIKKPTPSSETFAIWDKEKAQYVTSGLGSEEAAAKHVQQMIGEDALQDALKYEGEMLAHCVGGYCPDVVSGRSRIFSLRDQDGKPHATIEVEPDARVGFRLGEGPQGDEFYVQQNKYIAGQNEGSIPNNITFAEWWRSQNGIPEPKRGERISQIKGLKNRKPQDEYMPYVQDFVKGGDWSHIGDLHHTDLFKVTQGQKLPGFSKEIPPGYYTLDEFKKMAAENEMPQEILDNWMEKLGGRRFFGMKEGGAVDYESKFNKMLQDHVAGMAEGGAVDYESRFNDMLQKHVHGMAEGGEVENIYNNDPDMADGGRFIQAPAFANGGAVKSIWTVN